MATNNSVNGWRQTSGSGSPTGLVAGNPGDQYFDSVGIVLYICSVAGTSGTATWVAQGGSGSVSNAIINVTAASGNTPLAAGTYNNGSSGVGATYTFTATGAQTVGGTPIVSNGIYLIAANTVGFQNGIYLCTTLPATGVNGVLTRATNYNTTALINSNAIIKDNNLGYLYALSTTNPTIGSSSLVYDFVPYNAVSVANSGIFIKGSGSNVTMLAPTTAGMVIATGTVFGVTQSIPTSVNNLSFVDVTTTTQTMSQNTSYLADASAALTTFTLPTTAIVGSVIEVDMNVFGTSTGWKISQNAGQGIAYGTSKTTAGTGGSLASSASGNSVTLKCVVANTNWQVISSQGNLTVV